MSRRGALAVPVLMVVLVLALLAACAQDEPEPEPEQPEASTCIPVEEARTVADLNDVVGSYRRRPDFVGADVGASVLLGDGRRLWVFGDTLRRPEFDGPSFVHNSMLLIAPGCARVVLPADHGAFFPDRGDGVGYWPMSVARQPVPGGDLVGVGLLRVKVRGTGVFDFDILGTSVGKVHVPTGGEPVLEEVVDVGADRVDDTRPTWGAAVALHGDRVYLYGTSHPPDEPFAGWSLHVARMRVADLTRPDRWRRWDGAGWSRRAPAVLIPARTGVSRVLSVFERDGSWYAVSKRNDVIGTDLVVWKAPAPQGPWVAGPAVAQIPSDDGVLQYMPLAHPDLLPEPGSVVVSWSRNVADLRAIAEDPTLYRPEFARVPLP